MPARQIHYAESAGLSTTTSNIFSTKAQLTFTPEQNADYFIIGSAVCEGIIGSGMDVDIYHNNASTSFNLLSQGPTGPGDKYPYFHVRKVNLGSATEAQTFLLRYRAYSSGQSYGVSNALLVAIKADPKDQYAETLASATTALATPQDRITLGFTPDTPGEYVVLGSTDTIASVYGLACDVHDGASSYGVILHTSWYSSQHLGTHAWMFKTSELAGAQIWKMRYWRATGTGGMQKSTLAMLRADAFDAVHFIRENSTNTTTSLTPVVHATMTPSVQPVQHLAFASQVAGPATAGTAGLAIAGQAVSTDQPHEDSTCPTRGYGHHWMILDTPSSAGQRVYELSQWCTATGSQEANESSIVALQIGETPVEDGGTASYAPDAILASTNLGGSPLVSSIQDDPDSPDANWLDAASDSAEIDLRVSFPDSPNDLVTGAGLQSFKLWLRKSTDSSATPTIDVSLYEGGALRALLADDVPITSSIGQLIELTWDAALLSSVSGAGVELRIQGSAPSGGGGGIPTLKATGDVGTSSTSTGARPTYPAGIVAGDFLVLHYVARASSTPAGGNIDGWTNDSNDTRTGVRHRTYFRIADGAETSGAQVTVPWTATTGSCIGRIHCFEGVDTAGTPTEGASSANGSSSSIAIPSTTTTGPNRLAVAFSGANDNNAVGNATGETGGDYTQPLAEAAFATNTGCMIDLQAASMSSAGTISGGSISMGATDAWICRSFALVPMPAVAGCTVDVGAIRWLAQYEAQVPASFLPSPNRAMQYMMMR